VSRSGSNNTALNLDMVGKKMDPVPFTYDEDRVLLYALGIGAGVKELDFVYEKTLRVFPTFAVIPFVPSFLDSFVPQAKLNLLAVLHGEHKIILHKPIPTSGTIHTTTTWDSVYDKGDKGAMLNVSFETRDENGDLLFENRAVIADRSAGNFGGEKGPKSEIVTPPEGRAPDFRFDYATSPDQAALYRLSGDKNPMHIDPDFAKKGGFDRPILQGLCTFGFAARAILYGACDGDPARFKSFSARFLNVVFPGDTLITEGWHVDQGRCIIQTKTQDGRPVLGNARAEVA
jgi:acyl dehydratase